MTSGFAQAAWSWTEHLRHGGTTPWSTWVGSDHGTDVEPPDGWSPPGAAQLELLRTFAARAAPDAARTLPVLAELVLSRAGPGRGLAQQPLSWAATPRSAFGAPPVDPADVPVAELLRLGIGVLSELLLTRPTDQLPEHPNGPTRRRRLRRPAFRLAGAPLTAAGVRRGLGAAGLVEGGHAPRVLVFAEPLDEALVQVWSARVQGGAAVRWSGFLDRWATRPQLPPAVDAAAVARRWAEQVGDRRVDVVCGDPVPATSRLLGVRFDETPGSPRQLSPPAVDVVRRVNAVLNVRVPADRRAALRQVLVDALAGAAADAEPLGVPARHQDWVRTRARRLADELLAGNYAVHGSPERLLPRSGPGPTHPRRADTLGLVGSACLAWAAERVLEQG